MKPNNQLSLLPSGITHTATTGAAVPPQGMRGTLLRSLVARVLAAREDTLRHGWCRVNPVAMRMRMRPLQQWLHDHPAFVGDAACLEFWQALHSDVYVVAPSNPAGRKALKEMEALIDDIRA